MSRLILMALLLAVTGCAVAPVEMSPLECRQYGVVVADGSAVTGTIVSSEFKTLGGVQRVCGGSAQGCTIGVSGGWPDDNHAYRVYYAESKCVAYHEMCHAMYEQWNHTVKFNIRAMQGDKFAACKEGE